MWGGLFPVAISSEGYFDGSGVGEYVDWDSFVINDTVTL